MAKEETVKKEVKIINKYRGGGGCGAVYGMGVIGALFYYLQGSPTGNEIFLGILKSLAWPGFLIYRVLQLLKM